MGLELLSINEDNGHTDRISATQMLYSRKYKSFARFTMSVTDDNKLIAKFSAVNDLTDKLIEVDNFDIQGAIDFLEQAKQFKAEADLAKKLQEGFKKTWK